MTVSVFELFRIGVGPSSSHTVGPMQAGLRFARLLHERRESAGTETDLTGTSTTPAGTVAGGAVSRPAGITVILYGSLAATGAGHGTLGACLLGLDGCDPASVNPDRMESRLREIRDTRTIHLAGDPSMPVTCGFEDIILRPAVVRTVHTNAVTFSALEARDGDSAAAPFSETYYSIGGGFIRTDDETASGIVLAGEATFSSAAELLQRAEDAGSVAAAQRACERLVRSDREIDGQLDAIVQAMDACAERGMGADGVLPGGLLVRRRAHRWYTQLTDEDP
ncbi:MAG: serine dehydratase beta chain, partial [Corynebacterium variabile]